MRRAYLTGVHKALLDQEVAKLKAENPGFTDVQIAEELNKRPLFSFTEVTKHQILGSRIKYQLKKEKTNR